MSTTDTPATMIAARGAEAVGALRAAEGPIGRWFYQDRPELLDLPGTPTAVKQRILDDVERITRLVQLDRYWSRRIGKLIVEARRTRRGKPVRVLDVAHNAQAARSLVATLKQQRVEGRTLGVIGMLKDKDIVSVIGPLASVVDRWYPATLHTPRGASTAQLIESLAAAGVPVPARGYDDVHQAYAAAQRDATAADRIVVFGSFHTVGDILAGLGKA